MRELQDGQAFAFVPGLVAELKTRRLLRSHYDDDKPGDNTPTIIPDSRLDEESRQR
jgi:hypothetical protein